MSVPMYDPSVEDLVRDFLGVENLDSRENVEVLAGLVQSCIEDFIAGVHDAEDAKAGANENEAEAREP